MHVGLNLIFLLPGETGGIETYAAELIRAFTRLQPDVKFTAFINEHAVGALPFIPEGMQCVSIPVYPRSRIGWVPGELTRLPRLVEQAGCDLLHNVASTGPISGRFVRVTTVHDLIYRILPQHHRGMRYWGARYLVSRVLIPLAVRSSTRVITISHCAERDIRRLLKLPAGKLDVIPHGPGRTHSASPTDEDRMRRDLGLGSRRIVVCIASKWPHKNTECLIEAISFFPRENRPVVVVPGYWTPHEQVLRRLAEARGVGDAVVFTDWLSDDDLEGLYGAADACVLPSFYEGFGMPALEALSRGVPLLCASGGALEEVAGDAAIVFDPFDSRELSEKLKMVLDNMAVAKSLRAAAPRRAAQFTWEASAKATLEVYRRALAHGSSTSQRHKPIA